LQQSGKRKRKICSMYRIEDFFELNPPKTSLIISSNAEKYAADLITIRFQKNKVKNNSKLLQNDAQLKNRQTTSNWFLAQCQPPEKLSLLPVFLCKQFGL